MLKRYERISELMNRERERGNEREKDQKWNINIDENFSNF